MSFTPNLSDVVPGGISYVPRDPRSTILYQIVQDHWQSFLALSEADGGRGLPSFVKKEFEEFLKCGVLDNGFKP